MKAILTLSLVASMAHAAPVPTWNGPTEFACDGRCDQAWAETQLNDDERAELMVAKARQPYPQFVEVHAGDLFGLQTFFKDEPVSTRRLTVSGTYATATGWQMDGWSWVKIDACQNWTKVLHNGPEALAFDVDPATVYAATSALIAVGSSSFGQTIIRPVLDPTVIVVVDPDRDPKPPVVDPTPPPPPPAPSPVPMPATAWLLLAGLVGLFGMKWKAQR